MTEDQELKLLPPHMRPLAKKLARQMGVSPLTAVRTALKMHRKKLVAQERTRKSLQVIEGGKNE